MTKNKMKCAALTAALLSAAGLAALILEWVRRSAKGGVRNA